MDERTPDFDHALWRDWLLGPLWHKLNQMEHMIMATQQQVTDLVNAVQSLATAQAKVDADLQAEFTAISAEIAAAAANAGVDDPALDAALKSLNDSIADIGTQDTSVNAQTAALDAAAAVTPGGTPPAPTPPGGTPNPNPATTSVFPGSGSHINPALVGAGQPKV